MVRGLRDRDFQSRILYLKESIFQEWREINTFSDKGKLRKFEHYSLNKKKLKFKELIFMKET